MVISSRWPRTKCSPSRIAGQKGGLTGAGSLLHRHAAQDGGRNQQQQRVGQQRERRAGELDQRARRSRARTPPRWMTPARSWHAPPPAARAARSASARSARRCRRWYSRRRSRSRPRRASASTSEPSHQATGTVATAQEIDSSPTTYTGSLRTRSSHTPVGSENSTNGTISIAVRRPICVGEACSSTAAVSGSASSVTWPPNEEIRIEVHRRR